MTVLNDYREEQRRMLILQQQDVRRVCFYSLHPRRAKGKEKPSDLWRLPGDPGFTYDAKKKELHEARESIEQLQKKLNNGIKKVGISKTGAG